MLELAESIGLAPAAERDAAGGPLLEEEEPVLQQFTGMQLVIGGTADQGEGTLYFTEWRIFWLSAADPALGYSVDFPTISMHAVATDAESFNKPCLYLQLDSGADEEEGGLGQQGASDSGSEDGEEGEGSAAEPLLPELRIIPADAAQLDSLFQAFCEGAERNPDASDEEGEEGGGFFYNQDEALAGAAQAALAVNDVDELVGEDPSRFEDPEGEDDFEEFEGQQPPPSAAQNGAR